VKTHRLFSCKGWEEARVGSQKVGKNLWVNQEKERMSVTIMLEKVR